MVVEPQPASTLPMARPLLHPAKYFPTLSKRKLSVLKNASECSPIVEEMIRVRKAECNRFKDALGWLEVARAKGQKLGRKIM